MLFSELSLPHPLLTAVTDYGYRQLTPVQQQVLPLALAGHDLLVSAQTGSGKTAAFALPIIARLTVAEPLAANETPSATPKALILTPTRELAQQLATHFTAFALGSSLQICAVYGGVNFRPQRQRLQQGVDILIATPGRLFDHLSQDYLNLSQLQFLVLDEADRMLDMGFIKDIQRLHKWLPIKRQTMLFSATFPPAIRQLGQQLTQQPQWVELPHSATQGHIRQQVLLVPKQRKAELLAELVGKHNWQQTLVFVNTKDAASRLGQELSLDGISNQVFHGDLTQGARNRALAAFVDGQIRVLVATDVAARGLDIPALPRVINLELPPESDDYVHRIGRTGRAGMDGEAWSMVSPQELPQLQQLQQQLKLTLPQQTPVGYEATAPLPERYRSTAKVAATPRAKRAFPQRQRAKPARR
ncbi:DEAD/DEAH box helicase [Shewanella dokdonensis]|uniref:DEAD/DEAH box helicase n=1 Tax=Shewanella dokdonensis TaxID=712036 RepID=A0ABX8DGQ9_9GAMM|nr:DEAD/DEAH box helicase [Shewanella dokdonensis]MCL1074162.1 DEAD/DEAH box helicase [Shewanella dokdonensis]QVK23889.1 DEAD/DEAH box helicase [Shewanella dokdonensis]